MSALTLAMMFCVQSAAPAQFFQEATWLRDPVFEEWAPRTLYHKEDAGKPEITGPRNVHTLYRRTFDLSGLPTSAHMTVTADDIAHVYINGQRAFMGPEPGYAFSHYVYQLDVLPYLREGENVIAVHGYYQGLYNRVWDSGDLRAGVALEIAAQFEDGTEKIVATGESWRCYTLEAFRTGATTGYSTQFLEFMDMRKWPEGWQGTGFDDSEWQTPLTGFQDHRFVRALAPPVDRYRMDPAVHDVREDGVHFFDMGTEVVGHTRVVVSGGSGSGIEIRHGEELNEDGSVRYRMRANCDYRERITLDEGRNEIELFDYRAFRYIEVHGAAEPPEVWVMARRHPYPEAPATFGSSHALLNDIWSLCVNGVKWGSQGGFLDCPSREKGQYLGDALITSRSHLLLTADPTLSRKALWDFQQSQRICPGIMAVAPGSFMQEIAEFSLQWPMMLRQYYLRTGDYVFAKRMAEAAFEQLFTYWQGYENEHGLLTGIDEKWVLVDWPRTLRDNYDYEFAERRENTVVNAFYYASLRAAADLLERLDLHGGGAYEARAERVHAAFNRRMRPKGSKLYVDAPGSNHHSLHANAIPLAVGLAPADMHAPILDLIRERRLSCGVYVASFVIEACFRAGAPELAFDLMTGEDERSWAEMLRNGATACTEAWGPQFKDNMSWCHPWASSPVYHTAEYVMGLHPKRGGYLEIDFLPSAHTLLKEARIVQPLPFGAVSVSYSEGRGYQIVAPEGIAIHDWTPEDVAVSIRHEATQEPRPLHALQAGLLASRGWAERVGDARGVWVSIDEQVFRIIEGGEIIWQGPCSTAAKGPGSQQGSNKTPLGWHVIDAKIGGDAPYGQVFRGRVPAEMWDGSAESEEDLVVSRILWLDGLEPGLNQGGNVDSKARYIYIHGTNGEQDIGRPASHGCVRMLNAHVITIFDMLEEGAKVLITAGDVFPAS